MTTRTALDDKIQELLQRFDRATPTPPAFEHLDRYHQPERSRLVPLAGAAAVVAVGIGGLVVVAGRDTEPAAVPPNDSVPATAPPVHPIGPLLSTPLASTDVPFAVLGEPGWELTHASGSVGPLISGGFEGATVLVGDGPTYDAPWFAASVVPASTNPVGDESTGTVPDADALLAMGEPIEVAGTTGSVTVTDADGDTGLTGPIVVLFWPLPSGDVARVNAVRLPVEEVIALADQLAFDGARLIMASTPDGFTPVLTPTGGDSRTFSYVFENGNRSFELVGQNRGVASLLGRIMGEVRTTRLVDGIEVADRPLPNQPGAFWVDWISGDWSFYVIAYGFADEAQFDAALRSLQLTNPGTFAAAGDGIGIIIPGEHHGFAERVLGGVSLTDSARLDAVTTELPMSADSYAFELVQGAACSWHAAWTAAAAEANAEAQSALVAEVQSLVNIAPGTELERAVNMLAVPLLEEMQGRQPEFDNSYVNGCPVWAAAP